MREPSENVQSLELAVKLCRQQLVAAERELHQALEAEAPFKVGDVVEARFRQGDGSPWVPSIIRKIEASTWSTWYTVATRNKDGSWSERGRNVFECVRKPGGPPDPKLAITPDML